MFMIISLPRLRVMKPFLLCCKYHSVMSYLRFKCYIFAIAILKFMDKVSILDNYIYITDFL